ncbi:flagellar hook-length control protein FliK [uncultured Stenotrophomonas sp.]|uniref:flagellar hook-length control protein FliK n=1 Tax=uncultured Stenotrophomonas sp. TaxID=165438 RepID=UPI0028E2E84C|nr:flagellar hook-length control protein FliK [uncultured Stenotrophomonas sp.]
MTPTFLGSSASATGSSTSATGTSARNSTSGSDRRDFDALLNAEPARKQTSSKADRTPAKPDGNARQSGADTASNATDDTARGPGSTPSGDSTTAATATGSAASDKPATPEPTDDADTAPWPPLGLAGLALAGPEAVTVLAAPAANAESATAAKADPLPGALPGAAPVPGAPALPAAAIANADTAPGPIALPLDASATEDAPLPEAFADAIANASSDTGADAPTTPLLHALHAAAELKANATNAPFAGEPTATPHVGGDDFDDAMSARIGWLADQKIGHATIKVTPHDLGLIEVRLQMDGDKVHATFSSAHADVRHALESSIPRLREMLNEQGFQLGNADVGQQHTAQDGKAGGGQNGQGGSDGEMAITETIVSPAQLMRQRGLVDAYA